MSARSERIAKLKAIAKERVLILDGSWGVMFQKMGLQEADYRGDRFATHPGQMKGNNDILCLTRPDLVAQLHTLYFEAGADISETNTFSATTIAQDDYKLDAKAVWDINYEGARIGRKVAEAFSAREPDKPRFLAGSIGPLNKMLSMSSDVNDPGARLVDFDEVYHAYRDQIRALNEGGVDLYLVETITDTLNCKAALKAIMDLEAEGQEALPIWISGTITDRSGRTLSGQTTEAFWNSVKHAKPFAVGFNCALGADLMRPFIAEMSRVA
ncbi:MAG: homocysteine S-methyltransferase family protein, partial [Hyphomonadaceae bacterium]